VESSDVEGAIRMALAADDQLVLPTLERKGKLALAQISTRKKTVIARTPTQDAYMRAMERAELVFGVGPAAPARPTWQSPTRRNCSSAALSSASSCRVPRWKRASASASCPAT
jgi:hypothetical protein